ncbi:MAG: hypothetical protein F4139_02365 [Gemmatimonadetes bacterium]|nr:hypothetical protein [Gemmatimonadota bacterium]MYH51774.1 hypothetical protein [Gemmatimonadota bacterium]MYK67260.1 hypothetical protein [Gemmatimonadota bacterium]
MNRHSHSRPRAATGGSVQKRSLAALNTTAGSRQRRALTLITTAAMAGCASSGATFGYGLPSPPDAVYQVSETVEVEMDAPGGLWRVQGGYSMTLDMSFETDTVGIRVGGIAESFQGSLSDPIGDFDSPRGTVEFKANRGGVVHVESFPRISGMAARELSLAGLAYDIFPRMPGDSVGQGDTWQDEVIWHTDQMEAEFHNVADYTYTLMGDTVVAGRELVHIAVAADLSIWTAWGGAGNLSMRRVKGPLTGFILWDPERGLVAYHEYGTEVEGTVTKDEQSFDARMARRVRIRLN